MVDARVFVEGMLFFVAGIFLIFFFKSFAENMKRRRARMRLGVVEPVSPGLVIVNRVLGVTAILFGILCMWAGVTGTLPGLSP